MPWPYSPPQPDPQPKRPRRFWLYAPYAAVLLALIVWTGVWWTLKTRVEKALNDGAAGLRHAGYTVSWTRLDIHGWPFRMNVDIIQPRLAEASGWSFAAPVIKGEGLPYAADHWIFAATEGATVMRPGKGPLEVGGRAIRASVSGLGTPQPRFSFEALGLTLTPAQGALPPAFTAADRLELHLQPGPNDQAALLIRLEGASLQQGSMLTRLVPKGVFGLVWDARLNRLSALHGPNWPAVIQSWTIAGGQMTVAQGRISLGDVTLAGSGGPLIVALDGRLSGVLPLTLDLGHTAHAFGIPALTFSGPLALRFQDGQAAIGAFPLGPAPKVG